MNARRRFILCLAAVTALYFFHVGLKLAKITANPTWDAKDEVGQFWSEFAFHYRFAKFFAEHPVSDWGQLAHDRSVQYPDEINDWAEFTVAMEVPVGVGYRWAVRVEKWLAGSFEVALPEFHVWVVWYDCAVGSLTLFGVFLLARALWRSDFAGVMGAVLYAALYPSYGRTVRNLFLREDFALPLIVLALWATVRMWQEEKRVGWEIGAALAWLAALASWHLTQFVLAVGVGAVVMVYLGWGETPRRPWFVLALAVGAVLVPVLRVKQFWLSPGMCALYALSMAVWINGGRRRAMGIFAVTAAVLVAGSLVLRQSYGEYAHVYQLFFWKLRCLGVKPVEPGRLPWEARCLWEGAFNTAGGGEWWHSLMWCGPLAVGTVLMGWARDGTGKLRIERLIFMVFVLFLVPLAWMVVRYFTLLSVPIAVLAAGAAIRGAWWKGVLGAAAAWQLWSLDFKPLDRGPVQPVVYRPVVRWLRGKTPSNAVVLAGISESPVWRTFGERSVVMHSKFENRRIRERYREFLGALYGSEEELAGFARRYGADYFVYDGGSLMAGPDTWRYKADRMGELSAGCVAQRMWERPEGLREFRLEFRTERFVVFSVVRR